MAELHPAGIQQATASLFGDLVRIGLPSACANIRDCSPQPLHPHPQHHFTTGQGVSINPTELQLVLSEIGGHHSYPKLGSFSNTSSKHGVDQPL